MFRKYRIANLEEDMKKIFTITLILALLIMLSSCATVTPLGRAAKSGDIKKVEELLSKGANVNEVMTPGLSPLHEAVFNNAPLDIVRLLLDKGADVNMYSCGDGWASTCNCMCPLQIAACKGNVNMVKLLLDRGADIDAIDKTGYTPLARAAEQGQSATVKLLIEKGADTDSVKGFLMSKQAGYAVQVIEMTEKSMRKGKTQLASIRETLSTVVKSDVDDLPVMQVKPIKNAYAIVIGVEKYRQKLPKADFADHDARIMAEYLTKVMGYPGENVVILTGEHATKSDFQKYIEKWLPNNAEKDGSVFIYYSGHGAPNPKTGDAYLVPYDGDPSFIEETGYPLKRLYQNLNKLPAKEIIVVLDSCFSGAGGRSVLAKGARPLVMNMDKQVSRSDRIAILSASSGGQISSTHEEKGHGLFTYFFLKGLKGGADNNKDGTINIGELYGYIRPNVERVARKAYNNEQTPQLIVKDNQSTRQIIFIR
jgi:Caspase domain/Ankyrin repeats (3 copies)